MYRRVQSVLDRETVSHQKTLEQKISDQGPNHLRVDPHLLGLAIKDLLQLNRLREHHHASTATAPWFANPATSPTAVTARLDTLAPLYASVSRGPFRNLVGDALEVIVFKCLQSVYSATPRYGFYGHFLLHEPKDAHSRYRKIQAPKTHAGRSTIKEPDFLQGGHNCGSVCIECKNYREWIYPHHRIITNLILMAADLNIVPVLIARRLHYTTRTNFLEPAGIIAHESLFQYYPADKADLASRVSHKQSLGFTDVRASEEPHARTLAFFTTTLPNIVDLMAARWFKNAPYLVAYAKSELNLAELYSAIGSPAGGKWRSS